MTQQQKEELNNEFYIWSMKIRETRALTGEETANWWLSKFDQLIQEKVEDIERFEKEVILDEYEGGYYKAGLSKAITILKE